MHVVKVHEELSPGHPRPNEYLTLSAALTPYRDRSECTFASVVGLERFLLLNTLRSNE